MGWQRVGDDYATFTFTFTFTCHNTKLAGGLNKMAKNHQVEMMKVGNVYVVGVGGG